MQEDFEKGTPEAHDEGAINPETGVGPREVLKSFGFRGSAELYIALRELVPAGSLSTAMYIGVCAWYGLFYCRLCGDRLPGDRPKRIVDRWCDDCYTIISAEDVRNVVEAMLPPGSKPARSERDPDPWPESMYKPVGEKNHSRRSSETVNRTKWKPKRGKHAARNSGKKQKRPGTEKESTRTLGNRRSQSPRTTDREATRRERTRGDPGSQANSQPHANRHVAVGDATSQYATPTARDQRQGATRRHATEKIDARRTVTRSTTAKRPKTTKGAERI